MQIAVFRNPKVNSSVTSDLKAKKARGGVRCDLRSLPNTLKSKAIIKNGKWNEVASEHIISDKGSSFTIELDDTDDATNQLISKLRTKKVIEEIAIYELAATDNKEQYAYYFHKVFVEGARSGIEDGQKIILFDCLCVSFRQKDSSNNEPVLWDWNTRSHIYTGKIRS
ncbi:MAG TPA: hypothetical protein QF753_07110 [Victivallales bacterium]|nr:hypothetical protein [Victivallales bacterium]